MKITYVNFHIFFLHQISILFLIYRIYLTYEALDAGMVELCKDGSMIHDSHEIGGGGAFRDRNGRWLTGFAVFWGVGDVLTAKLRALHEGLKLVWEQGYRKVVCRNDCLELIELVMGGHDVNQYWQRDAGARADSQKLGG